MQAHGEAGAGAAAAIEVDFPAVNQLVATIQALADEVGDNGALYGQMNDRDLAGVLHRVEHDWRKERVTLQTFLGSMARSVTASLTRYHQLETGLVHAASQARQGLLGPPR
jgi:hypothetical protein